MKADSHKWWYYLLFLLPFLPLTTTAQFMYVGGGLSFQQMKLSDAGGNDYSSKANHREIRVPLLALYRPIRNIGIGIQMAPHINERTKYTVFDNWNSLYGKYDPWAYGLNVKSSIPISLIARIFFETAIHSYMDVRITSVRMTEDFYFFRSARPAEYYSDGSLKYGAVPAVTIMDKNTYRLISPGIHLGLMPMLSKNIYLDVNVGIEFLNLDGNTKHHLVEKDWDILSEEHEMTYIGSPVEGKRNRFNIGFGVGHYF